MADTLAFFAYGSLIHEPEWPEAGPRLLPARLAGHRRAFNKRSRPRGCDAGVARYEGVDVPARFREPGHRLSLALGTVPDPNGAIDGALLIYPDTAGPILGRMDRREGYDPSDPQRSGYLRTRVTIETPNGSQIAWTYLTNPASPLYEGALDLAAQARVLLHATPRAAPRTLGADYLRGVREALVTLDRRDPYLEALWEAVEAARASAIERPA